jgi:CHASE2 domain-containing sensor protein/class 3 adenylate cyclase
MVRQKDPIDTRFEAPNLNDNSLESGKTVDSKPLGMIDQEKKLRFPSVGTIFFSKFLRQVLAKKWPDFSGLAVVAIATLVTSGAVLGVRHFHGLERLELAIFDQMIRLRPEEAPDPRIVVVGITEQDIQQLQKWPISDEIMAQLFAKLQSHQPKLIGLDIYRDLPQGKGYEKFTAQLAAPNVLGIRNDAEGVNPPPTLPAERIGFNDLVLDADNTIRRNLMSFSTDEGNQTSFSLKLALSYLETLGISPEPGKKPYQLIWGKAVFDRLEKNSGGYTNADNGGYQILLNYREANQVAPTVTLHEVLNDSVDPELIKDKIVMIGTTASSLKDSFLTPYSPAADQNPTMPGVMIHTQMLSQILSAVLDGRPLFWFWPEWAEVIWIVSWTAIGATGAWIFRHPLALAMSGTAFLGSLLGSSWILFLNAAWVPVGAPLIGCLMASGATVAYRGYQSGQQKQIVMKLLGQSTSPAVADALWNSRDTLLKDGKLCGQKVVASMLFTDLKNFSTISEQMTPEALFDWLNEYLSAITETVQAHNGIINKFTGDGIMAAFGVPMVSDRPEQIAEDARNAVACGLAMGDRLKELNPQWRKRGLPVVQMRVGIFTGPVVAGSLGGKQRLEYGIIGDSVNIASRLESCEKDRQVSICRVLIAQETLDYLPDKAEFSIEPWGPLALKGKQQTVNVYRVIASNRHTVAQSE